MTSHPTTTKITTVETLHEYLYLALQLEHAVIPPYLLALYSIKPGTNAVAANALRVVVVEEMLHLVLAANILNAVGGKPDLTTPGFVPAYPCHVPASDGDFWVNLQPFSEEAVDTFMQIERPRLAPSEEERFRALRDHGGATCLISPSGLDMHFYSIGDFYNEIVRGLKYLSEHEGEKKLFSGVESRQITPEYYYSGGGELRSVKDLETAVWAANLINGQGEGNLKGVFDRPHELAHYYRFDELKRGKHYVEGDGPGEPTGPSFEVDWEAAFPFKMNVRLSDYPESSEVYETAVAFNRRYADFLAMLTASFNGEPELLLTKAVPAMFSLRNAIMQLIRNPIPGTHEFAAPTFEMPVATGAVTS